MSHQLYAVRLYWDGHHGAAKHDGVTVDLQCPPQPLAMVSHLTQIDYAPEVRVAQVRESADCWRDMSRAECAEVDGWLSRMSDATRLALVPPENTTKG